MTNCIAIDWLQLRVKMPYRDYQQLVKPNKYMIVNQQSQTRNFKALYTIICAKTLEEVAVIAAEPRNEMCMQPDDAIIKIVNKYLYQKNLTDFVRDLLKELQLQFQNITRLDIAYDFLKFDFMDGFANRTFMKAHACKFKMMGDSWSVDKGQMTGGISSLKFGKETSDVSYYLYNKTLELTQVKHKPWIHDHWKSNGWEGDKDVYRLEFSLHPDTNGIAVVNEDGELENVYHFKDLEMLNNIDQVYKHYFSKHFNFVLTEKTKKGNYKKQSRCQHVQLFEKLIFAHCTIKLSNKKDSGRSDKVFAKKLMQLNQELRGQDMELAIAANEGMTWIIKTRDLMEWQKKKLPDVMLSERVIDLIECGKGSRLEMDMQIITELPILYKSAKEQENNLIAVENSIKAKNFNIEADFKVPNYDRDGNVCGYVQEMF